MWVYYLTNFLFFTVHVYVYTLIYNKLLMLNMLKVFIFAINRPNLINQSQLNLQNTITRTHSYNQTNKWVSNYLATPSHLNRNASQALYVRRRKHAYVLTRLGPPFLTPHEPRDPGHETALIRNTPLVISHLFLFTSCEVLCWNYIFMDYCGVKGLWFRIL